MSEVRGRFLEEAPDLLLERCLNILMTIGSLQCTCSKASRKSNVQHKLRNKNLGLGAPSKTQKPVKSRGVSYPKDGAAHELPLWGSKSKPASEVLG